MSVWEEWHTVPKRYLNALVESITDEQGKLIERLREEYDLIITGTIGSGKTHLATAYILECARNNISAKYITEYRFAELFMIRNSKDIETARSAEREIEHCKSYRVLVIDEVGKRSLTEKQNIELDELISARYDNMLRTIIVSNLTSNELKKRIGDRAYDRLKGNNAKRVTLVGASMRGVTK